MRGSPSKTAFSVRDTSSPKAVLSARGPSPPNEVLSVGSTNPPKAVLSVLGTSPPKSTPGIGEEGARSPLVRRRQIPLPPTGFGLVNPTGLKLFKPVWSYSVAGSGKRARKIGDAVGAAFAVLKCAVEHRDELKLPLDSCIEGPHCANALLCLVARGYAENCSPQYPRKRLGAQTMLPVPKSRGFQCLSELRVARLIYVIFTVNETSSGVTVSPNEPGAVFGQPKARTDARSYFQTFTACSWPKYPINKSGTPKETLSEMWPLLTAGPRRGRDFLVLVFAVQMRNRLG